MEYFIVFAVFAAAAYLIYRDKSKKSGGGSYRGNDGNDKPR